MDVKNLPLVSIYTCVYNGEKTIDRVFKSVKNLDYPNIEHIIVNDGSTDRTEELVKEYIEQSQCVVKYHKKENGGKHTALNIAWDMAEGFFLIQLDADDELLPHSISYLVDEYYKIPEDIREQYWCVHGRCVTQHGKFVGEYYPEGINNNSWQDAGKIARRCPGEKIGIQRRDYLAPYRFPLVKGVTHVPEGIVWAQLNSKYGTWYTNEVVRVYYVGEGGNLTAKDTKRRQFGAKTFNFKWKLMNYSFYGKSFKTLFYYSLFYYLSDKNYRRHNRYLEGVKKRKILLVLLTPATSILAFVYRKIKKIK